MPSERPLANPSAASPAPILPFPRAQQPVDPVSPHVLTDADVLQTFTGLILAEFGHELRLHENSIFRLAAAARTGVKRGRRNLAVDALTTTALREVQFVRRFVVLMQETLPTLSGLSPDAREQLISMFSGFYPPSQIPHRTPTPALTARRYSANDTSN
jgi:hypothetical protein